MNADDLASIAKTIRANLQIQPGERLYTVVDACQDTALVAMAQKQYRQPIRMLFQGAAAKHMGDFAPYLIPIDLETDYLEQWVARWGKNVGVLLKSSAPLNDIHTHLRMIFVVTDESGQEHFFRFYDPRVLRLYLPTCKSHELHKFFGPVSVWYSQGDTEDFLSFRQHDAELATLSTRLLSF